MPFFEKQLLSWPSADASAIVDKRRSEASEAKATGRDADRCE